MSRSLRRSMKVQRAKNRSEEAPIEFLALSCRRISPSSVRFLVRKGNIQANRTRMSRSNPRSVSNSIHVLPGDRNTISATTEEFFSLSRSGTGEMQGFYSCRLARFARLFEAKQLRNAKFTTDSRSIALRADFLRLETRSRHLQTRRSKKLEATLRSQRQLCTECKIHKRH